MPKKALAILAASTALAAVLGWQAWSAMPESVDAGPRPVAMSSENGASPPPLSLVSDANSEDDLGHREASLSGQDDEDEDEDEDDGEGRAAASQSTAAAPVAPPNNGLFGSGAPPRVEVN